jgi:hypothetical protein
VQGAPGDLRVDADGPGAEEGVGRVPADGLVLRQGVDDVRGETVERAEGGQGAQVQVEEDLGEQLDVKCC